MAEQLATEESSTPPVPSLERQFQDVSKKQEEQERDYLLDKETIEKNIGAIQNKMAGIKEPDEPDFSTIPRPKLELNKRFMIAAGALMVASIVGGAYLGVDARGAMAGMTGAINGLMKGRKDMYDIEMEQYNTSVNLMIQKLKYQTQQYDRVMKAEGKTLQEKMQELKILEASWGRKNHDLTMTLNGITKLNDARRQLIIRLQNHGLTLSNKQTEKEKNYLFMVGEMSRATGLEVNEVKDRYPMWQYYDDVQNMTIKRSVKKAGLDAKGKTPQTKYGPNFQKALDAAKAKPANKSIPEPEIVAALKQAGLKENE